MILDRLLAEKPHPWGILALFYSIANREWISTNSFYLKNKSLADSIVKMVWDFVKID